MRPLFPRKLSLKNCAILSSRILNLRLSPGKSAAGAFEGSIISVIGGSVAAGSGAVSARTNALGRSTSIFYSLPEECLSRHDGARDTYCTHRQTDRQF